MSRLFVAGSAVLICILSGCGGEQSATASPDTAAPLAISDLLASADIKRGQTMFFQCRACHSLEEGGMNKVGPNLYGVFGRKAGLVPGFVFTDALKNTDVVWTVEAMDGWLARPSDFLPGNRMVFVGVKDARERANLIAYLQQETGANNLLPDSD
ncbi:MAG: cytochrome c family protein [Gammaproteobacteria bacterium]|nr:cytochrome c family protein [Gammaproteobacteria bacterium]